MALVLVTDSETNAPKMTEDQKIVYYDDQDPDKKELPLDPAAMYVKIGDLGRQNKVDRDKYKNLRDTYADFKDIENISEWKENADKALATVENFNDKDWMKADKVEKLKADMKDSYDAKLSAKDAILADTLKSHANELAGKDGQIRTLMVSNKFASSPYFIGEKKKTILNPDIAESYFGKHFKVEDDDGESVLRAYHANGEPIISKVNPGEPAGFNEAMGIILDEYPGRDEIMTAPGSGSGGQGGKGNAGDGDDLTSLKQQHKKALENGQTQLAITLKNKIFTLEQAGR